ncbi:hypothetical protein, partial [Pricia sp.]|uniref:hypothetical protein n=1 Tax=Pricia sp. TaxID=2268138 RepID=UPI003593818D
MALNIKGHWGWYFLLMISPLLPDKLGLLPIYAFILVFLFSRKFSKSADTLKKYQKWILWAMVSFFLLYALSLLWGGDFSMGIKSVEK